MDPQEKKSHTGMIIGIAIAVVVIIILVWWLWPHAQTSTPASSSPQGVGTPTKTITNLSLGSDVYSVAFARATAWESDASLLTMTAGDTSGQTWDLIFVSSKSNGQALEVVVKGQSVDSTSVISLSGTGAALPQNIIAPDQALASAHAVPGYASASITSAQLVYNPGAKQWYWGMKTSSGETISIKATQ